MACPICKGDAVSGNYQNRAATFFRCQTCGTGVLTNQAIDYVVDERPKDRWLLQAYFRHQPEDGPEEMLKASDVERILSAGSPYGPVEQLDLLLESIAERLEALNAWSDFDVACDFPLIWARTPSEAAYLVSALMQTGLLEKNAFLGAVAEPGPHVPAASPHLKLTIEGWRRFQELRERPQTAAQAFVAMQFAQHTDSVYDQAIAPAIRDAGYKSYRVDRAQHSNRIDDEIIGQIRRSRFMVADFAGQRQGIYFEAGMMIGLGRTVIWMCPKDEMSSVHFDVRQYNTIFYESLDQAGPALRARILAIEGPGPGFDENAAQGSTV